MRRPARNRNGGVAHTLRAQNVKWVIVDEIDNDIT